MKTIEVELRVAIPLGYGGCVFDIIHPKNNAGIKTDCEEYGGALEDFFFEGSKIPKKSGIYTFKGTATVDHFDEMYKYEGVFTRQEEI